MQITRTSILSGIVRTMDLPITEQMEKDYINGKMIQDAFRGLTASQREFYMTGIVDQEWNAVARDDK